MDRVFSVDDIADQFWSPTPPAPIRLGEDDESGSSSTNGSSSSKMMNRSSSEWAFQRFLQEAPASNHSPSPPSSHHHHQQQQQQPTPPPAAAASSSAPQNDVADVKDRNFDSTFSDHKTNNNNNNNQSKLDAKVSSTTPFGGPPPPPSVPVDSEEYQAYLKSRLELACAAVALSRANHVKPRESAALPCDNGSQVSSTSQLGPQVVSQGSGPDPVKGQDKDVGGPLGIPSLPAIQKKSGIPVRSTTSGSSREESDEDEIEEETEATPADAKRMRRFCTDV